MTGKVTQVDKAANTFTVMAKGKPFTFGSKSLKVPPKVGDHLHREPRRADGGDESQFVEEQHLLVGEVPTVPPNNSFQPIACGGG
jgi:hypothetical protein